MPHAMTRHAEHHTAARHAPARRPRPAPAGTAVASAGSQRADLDLGRPQPAASSTRIRFSVPYHTVFGHHLAVVGSHPALGGWAPERACAMEWSPGEADRGDTWILELEAPTPPGDDAWAYKYIVRDGEHPLAWSPGENFGLPPVPTPAVLTVDDAWDGARHEVAVEAAAEAAAPTTAPAAAELSAALAAAGEAVATFGPASREALAADARVAAAEATLRSGSG